MVLRMKDTTASQSSSNCPGIQYTDLRKSFYPISSCFNSSEQLARESVEKQQFRCRRMAPTITTIESGSLPTISLQSVIKEAPTIVKLDSSVTKTTFMFKRVRRLSPTRRRPGEKTSGSCKIIPGVNKVEKKDASRGGNEKKKNVLISVRTLD